MNRIARVPTHQPDLLVVGHVTRDLFADGEARAGGAAYYAGAAAARLGAVTAVVTSAAADDPALGALQGEGVELVTTPSEHTTTFELTYASGGGRMLWLRNRATALRFADVPPAWRSPRAMFLGPVAWEIDDDLIDGAPAPVVGLGLQGWLRAQDGDGRIGARDPAHALALRDTSCCRDQRMVAFFSEDDHPGALALARALSSAGARVAITRGARGATLLAPGTAPLDIPAHPTVVVDPTGAGDVFAAVTTIALSRGADFPTAADQGAAAAARVVQGPGLGRL